MDNKDVTKREERQFLSIPEAAKIMGYSRQHVLRLVNDGTIKAQKVGRSFVVERNSLKGVYKEITLDEKTEIDRAVTKIAREYGEALRKLGEE